MKTELSSETRLIIWAQTSIQQVFLLLHEFGHAYYHHGRSSASAAKSNHVVWQSSDSEFHQEIEADKFAAQHMAVGPWPEIFSNLHEPIIFGLFEFFESLELLRKMQRYSLGARPEPRERFQHIASIIDHRLYKKYKASLDDHQSTLDDLYTAWSLSQEEV